MSISYVLAATGSPLEAAIAKGREAVRADDEVVLAAELLRLDGGLQRRASPFPAGLSLTPGIHLVPTRRVSGLTGSTTGPQNCVY
jgi:hypothetical protein